MSSPDLDLLFGLIALQNGLIDQGQLVAAFRAWILDRDRSLADHLVARGALDAPGCEAIRALADLHLRRHGDAPRSLAAMTVGQTTRKLLVALADPALDLTVSHAGSAPEAEPGRSPVYGIGLSTDAVLRYRVLRPHARGGLGAVFVALDAELNREVAFKQMLDGHADDPSSRQRFVLEAEITGGLEHPGIVPVYGLGHDPSGRPFYAMRFVRGDSLREAIGRFHGALRDADPGARSLALRGLLRRFTDVCNAIEYAHSRGVLHRDIKPGNVIVGRHGETLVVDWGLARAKGRADSPAGDDEQALRPASASASGSAETLPGLAMGTPGYMSPEQARGELDRLGPASDVYSLGATLYTLLTGRPPFGGPDARAVLQDVERGDFPPPRALDRSIDPALEAVCLKAMALAPADRYASARALADEVERWMADEPVSAWREPLSRRAARWVRRNRTAVTGAAVAAAAGVLALIAVAVVQREANRGLVAANDRTTRALVETAAAKGAAERALARSEVLRREAEESRKQAEAISGFMTEAFRSPDPDVSGRDLKVVDVLDRAATSLQNRPVGSDATRGALFHALAETYHGLGLDDRAVALHGKALALREKALGPDHPQTLASRNDLAWSIHSDGRTAQAIPILEAATARRTAVLGIDHPDTLAGRNDLGCLYRAVGRLDEAVALHEETLRRREAVLGADDPETLNTRGNLAVAYRNLGRTAEAIALSEGTLALMRKRPGPDHPLTLRVSNNLAMAYAYAGRLGEAVALHEETLRKRQVAQGPVHPETFVSRFNLATTYERSGRVDEARALNEESRRLALATYGPDHLQTLAAEANLARIDEGRGLWADAEPLRRHALAVARAADPANEVARADALGALGENLLAQSRWADAEPPLRERRDLLARIRPADWSRFHAESLLGAALLGRSRPDEAEPLLIAGYEGLKAREAAIPAPARRRVPEALERVIALYESRGRTARAAEWKARRVLLDLPKDVFANP